MKTRRGLGILVLDTTSKVRATVIHRRGTLYIFQYKDVSLTWVMFSAILGRKFAYFAEF